MQLSNKMRPMRFRDVKGQEDVVNSLLKQSKMGQWFNCYIFSGQFGGGKTTMARLVALAANCTNKGEDGEPCLECEACKAILSGCEDVMEIDGASNTGVDNIRKLQEVVACSPLMLRKRVIIIDEVHMLSTGAFNSALKLLEEPPEHCIFILCTTEVAAIPQTIFSRSAHYSFSRLSMEALQAGIKDAAEALGVSISEPAMELIASHANGSMRNAMVLLDQIAIGVSVIDENLCRKVLGVTDERLVLMLVYAVLNRDIRLAVQTAENIVAQGVSLSMIAKEIVARCTDLLSAKALPDGTAQFYCTSSVRTKIVEIAKAHSYSYLADAVTALADLAKEIKGEQTKESFFISCAKAVSVLEKEPSGVEERLTILEERMDGLSSGMIPASRSDAFVTGKESQPEIESETDLEDEQETASFEEVPDQNKEEESFDSEPEDSMEPGTAEEEDHERDEAEVDTAEEVPADAEETNRQEEPNAFDEEDMFDSLFCVDDLIVGSAGYGAQTASIEPVEEAVVDTAEEQEMESEEVPSVENACEETTDESAYEEPDTVEETVSEPEEVFPSEETEETEPDMASEFGFQPEEEPPFDEEAAPVTVSEPTQSQDYSAEEADDDAEFDETEADDEDDEDDEDDLNDEDSEEEPDDDTDDDELFSEGYGFTLPTKKKEPYKEESQKKEDAKKPETPKPKSEEVDAETAAYRESVENQFKAVIDRNYVLQSFFILGDARKEWEGDKLVVWLPSEADLWLFNSYKALEQMDYLELRLFNG